MPYDPFDPEELRRRQMLGLDNDVMAEDDQDAEGSIHGNSSVEAPTVAGLSATSLTPSQQRYKALLDQVPQQSNYKPSGWRRFGAAVAGGLAGLKDARTGVSVAEGIRDQPYNAAMNEWGTNVKAQALGLGVEKEAASEDIASRRASAYERSAGAREKQASANEAWRRSQEERESRKWSPSTKDEYMEVEHIRHPGAVARPGAVEQERQWMQDDPAGFEKYQKLKHAPTRTPEQEQQLIEYRARMTAKYRRPAAQPRPLAPAPPAQQAQAEHLAAQQLIRENPEWSSFYVQDGKTPPRFLTPNDLPQTGKGGFLGIGGVSEEQASLAREKYRQFHSKVKERASTILGSRATQGADDWEVSQDDGGEDDQEEDR